MRLALVNPNTSAATTGAMVRIARQTAPEVEITGFTAAFGEPLITDEGSLATSARAVLALAPMLAGFDGVVIAAFGDPALAELRRRLEIPVTGIAEAGMGEAAMGGRPFAVATTTPRLAASIGRAAETHGFGPLFRGTFVTPGDPATVMADPQGLVAALEAACRAAIAAGAAAVVIGGGPLAVAARALAGRIGIALIEPVPAAVRLALGRAAARKDTP
jgi:Asp/Glu/hydantoin racemase